MAVEGKFPKVDGNILFASEVNGFLIQKKDFNLGSEQTVSDTTNTLIGSDILTGANPGMIHSIFVKATTGAPNVTGSSAIVRMNLSGANTGDWFVNISTLQNLGGATPQNATAIVVDTVAGDLFQSINTGQTRSVNNAAMIPILDDTLAIKFYLRAILSDYDVTVSGIDFSLLYTQLGSAVTL